MKRSIRLFFLFVLFAVSFSARATHVWVEAENFVRKGGWVVDQQFMDIMGSSYLMAHGLGVPVEDAVTDVDFPKQGKYQVYVRTYNWTSPWFSGKGPGAFTVSVNGKTLPDTVGITGNRWEWQKVGTVEITQKRNTVQLHDLTGFNGRCDALLFTTDASFVPPTDGASLESFRRKCLGLKKPQKVGNFDLVVTGGGIAGICAAVSAARLGLQVALINDRPVLGGNNSSEIRVHLGGRIEAQPYDQLGNLIKEFGPERGGNAQPASYYEDDKKAAFVAAEKNITLFPNYRVVKTKTKKNRITGVIARHIESSREILVSAPLFVDCTGDGTVGVLSGADYAMGRESRDQYGEPTAPEKADSMTMGASVQWYSEESADASRFPEFCYGIDFNAQNAEKVTKGEWTWETGMNRNQITEFEQIRDYGLLVVFSNWSYLKNESGDPAYRNRRLAWVAYISGKRESRRLLGDYILTENDIRNYIEYEDGTASTTWSIDLHDPDPINSRNFPGREFKAISKQTNIYPYPIPYRCLYSRNIENLFMAGRNISVSHTALGTVRVMRTTGMMGEVVGMAAYLCKKHNASPRDIYPQYWDEMLPLLQQGTGKPGLPNNQRYNEGGTLREKPSK